MDNVLETIRAFILHKFLPGEDPACLTNDSDLKEDGVLDSLSTLKLVSFLEEQFKIEFEPDDLGGGGLSSVTRIERLVRNKMGRRA
jgi:acyl carrier protein